MVSVEWWQIVLITLYSGFAIYDGNNTTFGFVKPTMAGFFAGLILGDIQTGLIVGGTLNLLVLGVGNFGGASIPDYMTGALLGTAFTVMSGQDAKFGATLAIPIGLLMVQLDVLARFTNTFFQHKAEKLVVEGKFKKASYMNLWGIVPTSLSRMIPVFLALVFGAKFVQAIVDNIPKWLMGGLQVAGGLLPALGIAILLKYLPIKQNIAFLIIGFFLAAYLKVPVLGVALIGLAMAIIYFQTFMKDSDYATNDGGMGDE
ncbi:PTS mannose/fructose/sorbose/N-acetylgalactosamine transporter subunit IIC [Bacillus wiedmannii]|uniref:PTS mannose/fructose/sorbose/N-acetylgalactosamine transporter subunit IIC n=1 Tax=Bacillus wiedmannii TaxID=1890302 RepID=UPI000BF0F790|nr:PTS sugar transporter subunit IIC [Bacillus wiedmannii]PEL94802.1 PTS sorbose transporter subunit IIC [Bacillus wiedmannii]PGB63240.1 PTS sorbose transporter subunit IIC [Bacillus wiedmannii]